MVKVKPPTVVVERGPSNVMEEHSPNGRSREPEDLERSCVVDPTCLVWWGVMFARLSMNRILILFKVYSRGGRQKIPLTETGEGVCVLRGRKREKERLG